MFSRNLTGLLVVAVLLFSGPALADTLYFDVGPSDLTGGPPFGYDPDQGPPIATSAQGAPTGFGNTSFWSNVQGSTAGGPRDYTSFRFSPKDVFSVTSLTIGDLREVSFWTKNMGQPDGKIDWQLKIYTVDTDASGGWYDHRFNFVRPDHQNTDWNESSTDTNMLVEWIRDGGGASVYPSSMSLTDLANDTDYNSEVIYFIDIIAGFATDSPPVDSYLDGVTISIVSQGDGSRLEGDYTESWDTAIINFVPLPGAGLTGLALLAGLGATGFARRRRRA